MMEQIAVLATAIWILTAALKQTVRKPDGSYTVAPALIALALGVVLGVAAALTGWIEGNPIEVASQVVIALFAAKLTQDAAVSPVKDVYRKLHAKETGNG